VKGKRRKERERKMQDDKDILAKQNKLKGSWIF